MHSSASTAPVPRPFRIAVYPAGVTRRPNPYFTLCHTALARHGIAAVDDLDVDVRWLEARSGSVDAVHLHWPEFIWQTPGFGRMTRAGRAACAASRLWSLHRFVRAARRRGLLRIWTVHNIAPHEGGYRWDRYGYRLLARESDLVICHSHASAEAVRRAYRPLGRVVVMPIGNVTPALPAPRPRAEVLAGLRLDPRLPVVSCLGRLRAYKGLDIACAALERLQGRVQLIIGGLPRSGFDVDSIRAGVERLAGAVLLDRRLSDQEFADLSAASDAALLPYRAITSSSALLASLSFERGVVVSDLPYFREILAGEPDAGLVVRGDEPSAWADGIQAYLSRRADARTAAARRLADRYSWDRCVEPFAAALGRQAGAEPASAAGAA